MTDNELEAAIKVPGLTEGQRQARELVVASRLHLAAAKRDHDTLLDLRFTHGDDRSCELVAEAIRDLGVEPVGDYVVVMNRNGQSLQHC